MLLMCFPRSTEVLLPKVLEEPRLEMNYVYVDDFPNQLFRSQSRIFPTDWSSRH